MFLRFKVADKWLGSYGANQKYFEEIVIETRVSVLKNQQLHSNRFECNQYALTRLYVFFNMMSTRNTNQLVFSQVSQTGSPLWELLILEECLYHCGKNTA